MRSCSQARPAASLWQAGRSIVRDCSTGWIAGALAAWVLAILAVVPMRTFAQREHIAVIALLPFLAVLWVRGRQGSVDALSIVATGVGAGIAVVIKPHFALAVGSAIVVAAFAARSWRVLFAAENWIAGGLAVAYGAFVIVCYPEFVRDIVPLVQAVYLPIKMPLWKLALRPAFLCWLGSIRLLTLWRPGALSEAPYSILLAASGGFALAYLIQGKGWPYHSYPMVALGLLALAVAACDRRASDFDARAAPVGPWLQRGMLAALVLASAGWGNLHRSMDAAAAPIRQAVSKPRMLVIASDFAIGHPLTRQVDGEWVSRVGSLWISSGVFQQLIDGDLNPEQRASLIAYAKRDRDMLAEDIQSGRPDIIVVQRATFDWMAWAQADPTLAEKLKDYRPLTTVASDRRSDESFLILQRNGPGPAAR